MAELSHLTARKAARCIARVELTREELVRTCAERIATRDDVVKGWAHFSRSVGRFSA